MPVLKCPLGDQCNWEYPCDFGEVQSVEIIKMHVNALHSQVSNAISWKREKPQKIYRPTIDFGIN